MKETVNRLRKIVLQAGARPGTHVIALDNNDSVELAGVYQEFTGARAMTLQDFIEGLKSGDIADCTFRGLRIKWFCDYPTSVWTTEAIEKR